jgi:hypothetical protein
MMICNFSNVNLGKPTWKPGQDPAFQPVSKYFDHLRPVEAMETTSADKDLAVMKQRLVDGANQ